MLKLNVKGDTDLYLRFRTQRRELWPALEAKVNELSTRLQQRIQAKLRGPVLQMRSGKLLRSIEIVPAVTYERSGIVKGGVVGAGGPAYYGRFHETGTDSPYEIRPVSKQALRFMIGNKVIFAKRVIHPAIRQRSFMQSTQQEMTDEMIAEIQETVGRVFQARPR